ncbi:hypothetical protein NOVOSPHI9U_400002 [Novosphingobium sp. 9U]|nr:hypothetical protein NOVOSPHI9U_400002 [Novosphingobium sp. 9U]
MGLRPNSSNADIGFELDAFAGTLWTSAMTSFVISRVASWLAAESTRLLRE